MDSYCIYCTAKRGEKSFGKRLRNICDSCARMRVRDRCKRCNGPRMKDRCTRCDPAPKGMVEVILLDPSEEERVVYRSKDKSLRVNVAGRRVIAGSEMLLVISLSRKEFLSTLC